jgi:hypothetical protein
MPYRDVFYPTNVSLQLNILVEHMVCNVKCQSQPHKAGAEKDESITYCSGILVRNTVQLL